MDTLALSVPNEYVFWIPAEQDVNYAAELAPATGYSALVIHRDGSLSRYNQRKRFTLNAPDGDRLLLANCTAQYDVYWGTKQRIAYFDPQLGALNEVGFNGSLTLRVNRPHLLFGALAMPPESMKMVEQVNSGAKGVFDKLRGPYLDALTRRLKGLIDNNHWDYTQIGSGLGALTDMARADLYLHFFVLGIEMVRFSIDGAYLPNLE